MSAQDRKDSGATGRMESVHALLSLEDEAFVRAAYRKLLGREVDDSGLANYLNLVRLGTDRGALVVQLSLSLEGRQHAAQMDGLDALVKRLRDRPKPAWRRVLRRLWRGPDAGRIEQLERQLRAMDNRLYRMGRTLESMLEAQGGQISALRQDLEQMTVKTAQQAIVGAGDAPTHQSRHARIVPPRAEQLYQELRRSQSRRAGVSP